MVLVGFALRLTFPLVDYQNPAELSVLESEEGVLDMGKIAAATSHPKAGYEIRLSTWYHESCCIIRSSLKKTP